MLVFSKNLELQGGPHHASLYLKGIVMWEKSLIYGPFLNAQTQKYPLPVIQDIIHQVSEYKYFTKLDFSMQYSTFQLHEES